jgi:phage baseplate assembly protein W
MSYDIKISNGDLYLLNGDLKKVVDSEKLIQDILKLCLTNVGSNPMAPWYGSFLSRSIIGSSMDNNMLIQISKSQLNSALENFKSLQDLQVKSFQYVTADEQLGAILDIIVSRNSNDYRLFDITIKAVTKGFKPITTAFRVSTI